MRSDNSAPLFLTLFTARLTGYSIHDALSRRLEQLNRIAWHLAKPGTPVLFLQNDRHAVVCKRREQCVRFLLTAFCAAESGRLTA